jgi:hypothetical protein
MSLSMSSYFDGDETDHSEFLGAPPVPLEDKNLFKIELAPLGILEIQKLAHQIFLETDHQWRASPNPSRTSRGILHTTLRQKYKETHPGVEEPPKPLLNELLFQISELIIQTSSVLHIWSFLAEFDTETMRSCVSRETTFQIYFEQYDGLRKLKKTHPLSLAEENLCNKLLSWFGEIAKKKPAFSRLLFKKFIEISPKANPVATYNTGEYERHSKAKSSFDRLITPKTTESLAIQKDKKLGLSQKSLTSLCFAKKFESFSENEPEELLKLIKEEKDPAYALRHFARFRDQKHFEKYINSRSIKEIEIYIEIFRLIPVDAHLINSSRNPEIIIDLDLAIPLVKEKIEKFYAEAYATYCQQSP